MTRFTASTLAELALTNPAAVVVYNERNDKVLGVAATLIEANEIERHYRAAWNYSATFVTLADFVG